MSTSFTRRTTLWTTLCTTYSNLTATSIPVTCPPGLAFGSSRYISSRLGRSGLLVFTWHLPIWHLHGATIGDKTPSCWATQHPRWKNHWSGESGELEESIAPQGVICSHIFGIDIPQRRRGAAWGILSARWQEGILIVRTLRQIDGLACRLGKCCIANTSRWSIWNSYTQRNASPTIWQSGCVWRQRISPPHGPKSMPTSTWTCDSDCEC